MRQAPKLRHEENVCSPALHLLRFPSKLAGEQNGPRSICACSGVSNSIPRSSASSLASCGGMASVASCQKFVNIFLLRTHSARHLIQSASSWAISEADTMGVPERRGRSRSRAFSAYICGAQKYRGDEPVKTSMLTAEMILSSDTASSASVGVLLSFASSIHTKACDLNCISESR